MNKVLHTKFGTARINSSGYYSISSRKERNRGKLLHKLIFEDFYDFEIPNGFVVHHKDGNKLNNCILNLQLLSNKEHSKLHSINRKLSKETKNKISNSLKGRECSEETKQKIKEAELKNHARIIKKGWKMGNQYYCIRKDGKNIKWSIYPFKLVNWFTKEYPKEILQIKINN